MCQKLQSHDKTSLQAFFSSSSNWNLHYSRGRSIIANGRRNRNRILISTTCWASTAIAFKLSIREDRKTLLDFDRQFFIVAFAIKGAWKVAVGKFIISFSWHFRTYVFVHICCGVPIELLWTLSRFFMQKHKLEPRDFDRTRNSRVWNKDTVKICSVFFVLMLPTHPRLSRAKWMKDTPLKSHVMAAENFSLFAVHNCAAWKFSFWKNHISPAREKKCVSLHFISFSF